MKKYLIPLVLTVSILFVFWRTSSRQFRPAPLQGVRLVLFIVVDQFAAEYRDRFVPYATGGFRTLFHNGVVFTNAEQDHAITATYQGHAALYTGSYPRTNGIVGNEWFDVESQQSVKCVQDQTYGISPRRFLVSGLGGWLRERYGSSVKVFSVSGKARGAVSLGGRELDAAFWFDGGQFVSSTYFDEFDTERDWNGKYLGRSHISSFFGKAWSPDEKVQALFPKLGAYRFGHGDFPQSFPHPLGRLSLVPDQHYYDELAHSPFLDTLTTDFAIELLKKESIGQDGVPDFLGISYSALDRVGHRYGPHSEELIDTFFNVDRQLERLFQYVDSTVGMENTLVVLSSDHGVQSFPEYVNRSGVQSAHRVDVDDILCIQKQYGVITKRFGEGILLSDGYIDRVVMENAGYELRDVLLAVSTLLERCSFIKKVWTVNDLATCQQVDETCQRYARAHFPGRSPDFYLQPEENYSHWYRSGTGHGTPYSYDSEIPLVLMHPSLAHKMLNQKVSAVDVAPTVGALLGVSGPPAVEGRVWEMNPS